ncbi:MAG: peptidoglycan editing factor PgeF [Ignavibacteriae bacterium]|nr:peptidoglycan editing factor PgeF [Ignavibacteriota bacterium]
MRIIYSAFFNAFPELRFGLSTRQDGDSAHAYGMNLSYNVGDNPANVKKNREAFFGELAIELDRLAIPGQIHSNIVRRVHEPGEYPDCDGLITDRSGVFLCVSVADCVPVFLFDRQRKLVAAIHAGWRGTSAEIVKRVVGRMVGEFGSNVGDILAYIGPCAAACCYTVGEDVASYFDDRVVRRDNNNIFVDLKAANVNYFLGAGISGNQIEVSPYCTISDADLFHSYRRDGERSGRMVGVIGFV